MFCTNCGTQCEEGTRFCVNCGSALENPVTQEMTEKSEKTDYKIKEKNTSSQNKSVKENRKLAWIIAAFCCLIVVMLGGLVAVGMWNTRAELHMQAFLENMTSGKFQEAYEMLPEKERKKLSGESYQAVYQGFEITDGTITEVSKNDEEMVYKVSFVDKAGKERLFGQRLKRNKMKAVRLFTKHFILMMK